MSCRMASRLKKNIPLPLSARSSIFHCSMIDESTDVSVSQVLAIVVRFCQDSAVHDALLDIVEVEEGTADALYRAVKKLLNDKKIPLTNLVGFAADNCATMMGSASGFQAQLKADLPDVFVLGCVCHSFALCASHASDQLPSWLEKFLKDVCSYFARSSKRMRDFALIQEAVKVVNHRILKMAQTRWLSRGMVVARILEQWEPLKLFFEAESPTDKVDGAANIFRVMVTPGTKHMLYFLNYVLPKIDMMNLQFQSEGFRVQKVFKSIRDTYREILSLFVRDDVIHARDLTTIDPTCKRNHRPIMEVHLGGRCYAEMQRVQLGDNQTRFGEGCVKFLVELCVQIRKRFDFSEDSVLSMISCLDPEEALSPKRAMSSLVKLALKFPRLIPENDLDKLEDEWRALLYSRDQLSPLAGKTPVAFWSELQQVTDGTGEPKFPVLCQLMCALLTLPHSSACVERVFSHVNIVKTKVTNRLHASTVANRLLARQHFMRQDKQCYNWTPSKELIDTVRFGQCHSRYTARLNNASEQNSTVSTITLSDYDVVDVVGAPVCK